jgi:acetylornithine deacetylase/succinyl-diaminopimelate desuccinylase-like protein
VENLRIFLRYPTICTSGAPLSIDNAAPFEAARVHISTTYHDFLARDDVTVEEVNNHSLLITWKGASQQLPVLFNGHYDVVPVGNATIWQHGPFSGDVHDGCAFCPA